MTVPNHFEFALSAAANVSQADLADPAVEAMAPPPPPNLDDAALYGLTGEIVRLAIRDSEAHPAAVLATLLSMVGAAVGDQPFVAVGETKQYARLYAVIVGNSAKARKGTSYGPVKRIVEMAEEVLEHAYPDYTRMHISPGPLSSGEGALWAMRDGPDSPASDDGASERGVTDKRLFVLESEFGSVLKVAKREGNTLSTILRTLWDTGDAHPLTKSNRIKVTGGHLSFVGHITFAELKELLRSSDAYNGFGNRALWVAVHRPKLVPIPRPIPMEEIAPVAAKLAEAIDVARNTGRVELDRFAEQLWMDSYARLSHESPGVVGALTSRAEPQVLRLALIYALLDGKRQISTHHLEAAMAFWDYCYSSAEYIFGTAERDPHAEKLLTALAKGPMTQTDVSGLFSNHNIKAIIDTLRALEACGKIKQEQVSSGVGRPRTVWSLASKS